MARPYFLAVSLARGRHIRPSISDHNFKARSSILLVCKIPLLARALGLKAEHTAARPSARATIGYLVHKHITRFNEILNSLQQWINICNDKLKYRICICMERKSEQIKFHREKHHSPYIKQ